HPLLGSFLQCLAKGGNGLFELRCPALASTENGKRNAQSVLNAGPVERHALARRQIEQPFVLLNSRQQGAIVTKFGSLPEDGARLLMKVANPLVLVSAVGGKRASCVGEMLGGFAIPQSVERNLTASG